MTSIDCILYKDGTHFMALTPFAEIRLELHIV